MTDLADLVAAAVRSRSAEGEALARKAVDAELVRFVREMLDA